MLTLCPQKNPAACKPSGLDFHLINKRTTTSRRALPPTFAGRPASAITAVVRLVDFDAAALQFLAVEAFNCRIGVFGRGKGDETEAA